MPRVIGPNHNNVVPGLEREERSHSPMTLNAYTQTDCEDFAHASLQLSIRAGENEVIERLRVLEDAMRQQIELISKLQMFSSGVVVGVEPQNIQQRQSHQHQENARHLPQQEQNSQQGQEHQELEHNTSQQQNQHQEIAHPPHQQQQETSQQSRLQQLLQRNIPQQQSHHIQQEQHHHQNQEPTPQLQHYLNREQPSLAHYQNQEQQSAQPPPRYMYQQKPESTLTVSLNQQNSTNMPYQNSAAVVNSVSMINSLQKVVSNSVNYRIIANGVDEHATSEPIEIQIAEDDGSLNSSNASGQLEICLAEENTDVKKIFIKAETPAGAIAVKQGEPQGIAPFAAFTAARRALTSTMEVQPLDIEPSTSKAAEQSFGGYNYNTNNSLVTPFSTNTANLHSTSASQSHSKPPSKKKRRLSSSPPLIPIISEVVVKIGPNKTPVPGSVYNNIPWSSPTIATRRLLASIFDREILSTHSMTGRPSPAFRGLNKPQKKALNPKVVEDIIFTVSRNCNVAEALVRTAITTKCADENKMSKIQPKTNSRSNKENRD